LPRAQLGAFARLDPTIDTHQSTFNRRMRLAARADQTDGLQQLIELNEWAQQLKIDCRHCFSYSLYQAIRIKFSGKPGLRAPGLQ